MRLEFQWDRWYVPKKNPNFPSTQRRPSSSSPLPSVELTFSSPLPSSPPSSAKPLPQSNNPSPTTLSQTLEPPSQKEPTRLLLRSVDLRDLLLPEQEDPLEEEGTLRRMHCRLGWIISGGEVKTLGGGRKGWVELRRVWGFLRSGGGFFWLVGGLVWEEGYMV